jgi:hypothetical protein
MDRPCRRCRSRACGVVIFAEWPESNNLEVVGYSLHRQLLSDVGHNIPCPTTSIDCAQEE